MECSVDAEEWLLLRCPDLQPGETSWTGVGCGIRTGEWHWWRHLAEFLRETRVHKHDAALELLQTMAIDKNESGALQLRFTLRNFSHEAFRSSVKGLTHQGGATEKFLGLIKLLDQNTEEALNRPPDVYRGLNVFLSKVHDRDTDSEFIISAKS
jgi:hypothetical protein